MVSLIFKNLEGNAYKISKKHRAKRNKRDLIKTRVNDAPRHHRLYLLFRRCFSVASSFVNEKSPNHPFCCCLAMIGRKKGGGSFVFLWRKRSQKSKKKIKNFSPFLGFTFSFVTRATNTEEKKAISSRSQTAFPPVRPSVVEKDLEDVHHRGDV